MRLCALVSLLSILVACADPVERQQAAPSGNPGANEAGSGGVGPDGSSPSADGDSPPTGGATSDSGAASETGAGGTGNDPPECAEIVRNTTCLGVGVTCDDLPCGIADTGRRECACTGIWECTSCDLTNSPVRDLVGPFRECTDEIVDGVRCSTEWDLCGPTVSGEYCACYVGPEGRLIWDCDVMPACFWCL